MKKSAFAVLCVVFVFMMMSCAINQQNVRGPEIIGRTCPTGSMQVIVLYDTYDDVGPGFGPNRVGERLVLGVIAREACFVPEQDALVAWQSNKGYEFYYNEGGEDTFDLLQEKFGGLYPEHQTYSKGLTLPNGKENPREIPIEIYRLKH